MYIAPDGLTRIAELLDAGQLELVRSHSVQSLSMPSTDTVAGEPVHSKAVAEEHKCNSGALLNCAGFTLLLFKGTSLHTIKLRRCVGLVGCLIFHLANIKRTTHSSHSLVVLQYFDHLTSLDKEVPGTKPGRLRYNQDLLQNGTLRWPYGWRRNISQHRKIENNERSEHFP